MFLPPGYIQGCSFSRYFMQSSFLFFFQRFPLVTWFSFVLHYLCTVIYLQRGGQILLCTKVEESCSLVKQNSSFPMKPLRKRIKHLKIRLIVCFLNVKYVSNLFVMWISLVSVTCPKLHRDNVSSTALPVLSSSYLATCSWRWHYTAPPSGSTVPIMRGGISIPGIF